MGSLTCVTVGGLHYVTVGGLMRVTVGGLYHVTVGGLYHVTVGGLHVDRLREVLDLVLNEDIGNNELYLFLFSLANTCSFFIAHLK